jgi:fatty acid desaturase
VLFHTIWHLNGRAEALDPTCCRIAGYNFAVPTWQRRNGSVLCGGVSTTTANFEITQPRAGTRSPGAESGSGWTRHAREIVDDLHQRSALVYWTDLLLSAGTGWALALYYFTTPGWGVLPVLALLGAAILFFRAGTFIHEIVHFRDGELRWFARAWNLVMGIPLLMPWIIYRNHIDHHSVRLYGTPDDGEYLPLAASPRSETVKYVLQVTVLPLMVVLRFGVLGPVSWLNRRLREWVLTGVNSAGVSNPYYRKRFPKEDERHLVIVELLCFVWLLTLAVLVTRGVIGASVVAKAYVLLGLALGLNWVRNLAAHRYGNRGERLSLPEQVADSINITGQTWLTMLMFPVGLRYHALHHLFPFLPYHNLGKAHQRLMHHLPADSPYRLVNQHSYFAVVAQLWRGAGTTDSAHSAVALWRSRADRG